MNENQPLSKIKDQVKQTISALAGLKKHQAESIVDKAKKELSEEVNKQRTFNYWPMLRGIQSRLQPHGITLPNKPNFAVQDDGHGEFTICTIVARRGQTKILGMGMTKRNKGKDSYVPAIAQEKALERAIFGSLGVLAKAGIAVSQLKKQPETISVAALAKIKTRKLTKAKTKKVAKSKTRKVKAKRNG